MLQILITDLYIKFCNNFPKTLKKSVKSTVVHGAR